MNQTSEEEIIEFLKEMLSVSVTREQLSRPNKDFVIGIYSRFLEEFGFHSLNQPDIMASADVNNIEHMESIILPINIWKAIRKYVERMGFTDMKLYDILAPKRTRTLKIIDMLCTFYLRHISIKNAWQEIETSGAQIRQAINVLEQKNLDLKHAIEEKSMLLNSVNGQSVALEKEKSALVELNKKKKKEVDEQAQQFKQTKSEIMSLKDKLCEMEIEISQTKEKNKELSELIVNSPQKSIQITNVMEKALEETKREVPTKKQQIQGINKELDCHKALFASLKASTDDISNLLVMLSEIDNQCENLENIKQDAKKLEEVIKDVEIKNQEIKATKQGWQSKRNNSARQFAREFATLRELNEGLKQTENKSEDAFQQLMDRKQAAMQMKKKLEQQHSQLEPKFQSIRERYTQSIETATTKLIDSFGSL